MFYVGVLILCDCVERESQSLALRLSHVQHLSQ